MEKSTEYIYDPGIKEAPKNIKHKSIKKKMGECDLIKI